MHDNRVSTPVNALALLKCMFHCEVQRPQNIYQHRSHENSKLYEMIKVINSDTVVIKSLKYLNDNTCIIVLLMVKKKFNDKKKTQ